MPIKIRVVNMHSEPCDIRIDRGTSFGNPYTIGKCVNEMIYPDYPKTEICTIPGTREDVLKFYAWYLKALKITGSNRIVDLVGQIRATMLSFPDKTEIKLGCWCKPLACHGDLLAELVAEQMKIPFDPKAGQMLSELPYLEESVDWVSKLDTLQGA